MTSAGDAISHEYAIGVISTQGDVLRKLVISVAVSGAFQVVGTINDVGQALQILDNARDAIAGYHQRQGGLRVPGRDVHIGGLDDVLEVVVQGPIEDRAYALALFDAARAQLRDRLAIKPLVHRADHGLTVRKL